MLNNWTIYDPRRIILVAELNCPGTALELIYRDTVKCGVIVNAFGRKIDKCGLRVKAKLVLDRVFGKLLWLQTNESDIFRVHLTAWLYEQWRGIEKMEAEKPSHAVTHAVEFGKTCSLYLTEQQQYNKKLHVPAHVCRIQMDIKLRSLGYLCLEPDLRWSKRLLPYLTEYVQLQDVMAWLSTLGGAYSSMGDHFYSHSEKASQISQQQLMVAMKLGDPILAAQCKVFAAMSLIQRGQLKLASRIIREQFALAASNGYSNDRKLISSCQAAWCRIQYCKKQQKIHKERQQDFCNKRKDNEN